MKLIAIGGGEIGRPGYSIETKKIDEEIIKLSSKKNPKVLFIPTASGDSKSYYEIFSKYYGKKLKCKIDVLYLISKKERPTKNEIKKKIMSSDIIYVGGGNTLRILKICRRLGVDKLLKKASQKGIILTGLSAGAICWFKYGNSDSLKFGKKKQSKLIKLKGFNFFNLMVCPHYNVEKNRRPSLKKMIKKQGGMAIALENCSALEIINNRYRIITSSKKSKAYKIFKDNNKVIEKPLALNGTFKPLKELYRT